MKSSRLHRLSIAAVATAALLAAAAPALASGATPVAVAPGVPGQGRAWELVTPAADSYHGYVWRLRDFSTDGDRVSFMSMGPVPDANYGSPYINPALSVRAAAGWNTQATEIPYPELEDFPGESGAYYWGPDAFTSDLASSILQRRLPGGHVGIFRSLPAGGFTLLADAGPNGFLAGVSSDLQHVLFASEQHLLPADAARTEGQSIYELAESELRLVDVKADGTPISNCGASVYSPQGWIIGDPTPNQISRDGRRIFFSTRSSCAGPAEVYLRQDGTSTTEISASQCTLADCGHEGDATFLGANPDGSSAFILSDERLTSSDTNSHADLYRYDVGSDDLTLLSSPVGGGEVIPAPFPVIPSNGSRVYFRAYRPEEDLNSDVCVPAASRRCYFTSSGGSLQFVGRGDFLQTSADGRYALFESATRLAGTDSDDEPDVYRYDAESGEYVQVSIGGGNGNGPFPAGFFTPPFGIQGWTSSWTNPFRMMSADGGRLLFTTDEALLPQDRNESSDVYEWHDGELGLISSGTPGKNTELFLGMTADGRSVFFRTTETLLARDRDGGEADIYVARIGGGLPEPPVPPGECEGSACRAAPGGSRDDPGPPSETQTGHMRLAPVSKADRRHFVAAGQIELLLEVPAAGIVSATAKAKFGSGWRQISSKRGRIPAPGPVRLRLPLSRAVRRHLAGGGSLPVRFVIGMGGTPKLTGAFVLGSDR